MQKRLFSGFLMLAAAASTFASTNDSIQTSHRKAGPVIVRVGASAAFNLGFTEVLKSSIHEMRPNRDDNHSWPSRHTSWAFTAASVITHELYAYSPWWAVGAQTAANAVALQRTFSSHHFPKDVLGGAAVGLVSTELGYLLSSLIFPGSGPCLLPAADDWRPEFDAVTTAIFPFGKVADGVSARTGYGASLRFSMPCSDHFGVGAAFTMTSMPLYAADRYLSMLNSGGLSIGAVGHWSLPAARWGAEARIMPGISRNFGADNVKRPGWSFTLDTSATATFAVTRSFTLGAEAGYSIRTLDKTLSAVTLSMLSRVCF